LILFCTFVAKNYPVGADFVPVGDNRCTWIKIANIAGAGMSSTRFRALA
jgi:hypothetical protein